jgi:hypothetical protein
MLQLNFTALKKKLTNVHQSSQYLLSVIVIKNR